jgi:hypothetical protein
MIVNTKLDANNPQHQLLIATLVAFVDDFNYTPRELLELMDSAKNELYIALQDIYKENQEGKT